MATYVKRPIEVEAFQWVWPVKDSVEIPSWAQHALLVGKLRPGPGTQVLIIKTLEGEMTAQPGDWVIKGVKGELYPCKDEIFRNTYDLRPAVKDAGYTAR